MFLSAGNIEIVRCPDGYGVGDIYCTKSDSGIFDYDAEYPFETASYIARRALRKVRVRVYFLFLDSGSFHPAYSSCFLLRSTACLTMIMWPSKAI